MTSNNLIIQKLRRKTDFPRLELKPRKKKSFLMRH